MAIKGKKFSELTVQQRADIRDALRGYKVYLIKWAQNGTNAPTITVLENTLGWTPNWVRNDTGAFAVNNIPASWTDNYASITSRIKIVSPVNFSFHYGTEVRTINCDCYGYKGSFIFGASTFINNVQADSAFHFANYIFELRLYNE